jgi:NADPH:quinone reductase-like Zn-dependent oxidoreductase
MSPEASPRRSLRSLRFHRFGPAADVLQLDALEAPPRPGPGQIRVAVHACGLNPADWALCDGLFPGELPRGIGLEVSGVVDALGEGVHDVTVGALVFGATFWRGPTAGAADLAILSHWTPVPTGLDPLQAAALPMAAETAYRSLDDLEVKAGQTVLINGAGTMVGYAAVQLALLRDARVIATAGPTHAEHLRALGALVTDYGDGLAERVAALARGPVDLALDTGPASEVIPALIQATGTPDRVMVVGNFGGKEFGLRMGKMVLRYDKLPEFARLAAQGRLRVPIARTYPLEGWRDAVQLSQSRRARGKLLLAISEEALARVDG